MQPGDQVICSYQQYTKFKQLDVKNKELLKKNTQLEKSIKELNDKLGSIQHKFIKKNAFFAREQLKVEYLVLLLDEIRCALNIRPETIGYGFKEIKGMDQSTKFSVLRAPSDKADIEERLPEGFSKSSAYMEISVEFQSYKALAEVCAKDWKDRLKMIEYLEKEILTLSESKPKRQTQEDQKPQVLELPKVANEMNSQVPALQKENSQLKKKLQQQSQSLKTYQSKFKRASQKHIQQIATLKTQLMHMQQQLLASNKALKLAQTPSNNNIKTRLMNLITDYTISVSQGMMAMSLSAQDKKMIVEREVKDIEDLFNQSVKQLYG